MRVTRRMKKVRYFLPLVRANRYTYHNLRQKSVVDFKRRYRYLKSIADRRVTTQAVERALQALKTKDLDYIRKYLAMDYLILGSYVNLK